MGDIENILRLHNFIKSAVDVVSQKFQSSNIFSVYVDHFML